MKHLYGEFNNLQMAETKKSLRGSIFFLLLCVDDSTKERFTNIDVVKCFQNLMYKIDGLNELLSYPTEIVTVMCLLQKALSEYKSKDFNFSIYRKLILDAGAEISKIREED